MFSTLFGYLFSISWFIFYYIALLVGLVSMATFCIIYAYQNALRPQDLKQKYNAKWALVTGASSGIGLSICHKLAQQGVNCVMVALDDTVLEKAVAEMRSKYTDRTFRQCGCNLGAPYSEYLPRIVEHTRDLEIKIVFNNAGFILSGFFAENDIEKLRVNLNCNAVAAVEITHHFVRRMITEKIQGFIGFTSSSGGYLPGPTATLYSSTKCFLTNFASTLQGEVRDVGIDVTVVHPSPVATNFYANTGGLSSLETAKKFAIGPELIADCFFSAAGRILIYDQGLTTMIFRFANKFVDFAFFHELVSRLAYRFNEDHALLVKSSKLRNRKAD